MTLTRNLSFSSKHYVKQLIVDSLLIAGSQGHIFIYVNLELM